MRALSAALLIATVTAASVLEAADSQPPNVVFIMVDDLGWSDVGFNGSKVYETPNVDRLASQGMVFSDFYSGGPVCSPTRASIMTGKYTARTGITTYLLSPTRDAKHVQPHLPLEEFTIAEAFKKNGFATGYFGKWHLGYENEFWAGNQGFDVAKGGIDLPWAWTLCYPDIEEAPTARTWPKKHIRFFSPYHLTHLKNGPQDEYLTERLTNETIGFIEEHRDEPFFAFLSFHTVHTPLQARPEKIEKYEKKIAGLGLDSKKEKNGREKAFQNSAAYAAMVEHMDENVGRLLARLDELKLSDNTIVVWTSDNGGKGSVTSNLPLRGMKHNLYEGGIRVPTIVRWPKKIAAGSKNATPLISNDFYPTLLELTGLPAEPQQHVDGVSFADLLLGKSESVDRDAIYWHYPHSRQEAAVREGKYKLLHRFEQDTVELYDLRTDLAERHDLSTVKPDVAKRLLGKLKSWQKSVGAKFKGDVRRSTAMAYTKPLTIFASGDSTTAPRNTVKRVYADRLPHLLAASGIQANVINAGVGGSHTGRLTDNARYKRPHALDRLNDAVRAKKPDVVVQFGWNDSWFDSNTPDGPSRIPVEHFEANLKEIVTTLTNDGASVILMTPNHPRSSTETWRIERTKMYVNAVRALAASLPIPLVDVWKQYEPVNSLAKESSDGLLLDVVHPNDEGYKLVAQLLSRQIVQEFRTATDSNSAAADTGRLHKQWGP